MIVQLSSGQGPAECELAVSLLYDALKTEFPDIRQISHHSSNHKNCYTSIIFETESDLSDLEGSILWICKSPFRSNHKRKNWYVDVSIIPEQKSICDDKNIRFQSFHCGGKGGQNVNKVETGVRLIHIPSGITVTSTSERSQYLNKKRCSPEIKSASCTKETGTKRQAGSLCLERTYRYSPRQSKSYL